MAGIIEWFTSLTIYEKIALPLGAVFFGWVGKKIGAGLKLVFLKETNEKISGIKDELSQVKNKQDIIVQQMADHTRHSSDGIKRLEKMMNKLEGVLIQHLDKKS